MTSGASAKPDAGGTDFQRIIAEIEAWPKSEGVKLSDVMNLNEPLRTALNTVVRDGSATIEDFAAVLGLNAEEANTVVDQLLDHGFLREVEGEDRTQYRLWYAPAHRREKPLDLWTRVLDHLEGDE
ncbi:MAG TPA: hypothetical protein VNT60_00995 [Deinococcales bacterium]|nr:hypothetical protein [Deinococcales bacterium]